MLEPVPHNRLYEPPLGQGKRAGPYFEIYKGSHRELGEDKSDQEEREAGQQTSGGKTTVKSRGYKFASTHLEVRWDM